MSKIMYYFSAVDRRLRYGDNRTIVCGETHVVDTTERRLELCAYGLHASPTPFQALDYAPGPVLWQVRLGGEVITGDDKSCASERTYLAEFDATAVLRTFARRQALIHIEKIRPYCAPTDYDLILTWLTTGDESLRSAAQSATKSVAQSAAWSVAQYAARYAAWSAAQSAAWSAARSAASAMLDEMIRESTGWEV